MIHEIINQSKPLKIMKQIITLLLILLSLNTINSQDVPEIQQSLITKITATWCPYCGGWGWDFYNDIYSDNNAKALIIKANYSGDLQNNTASDFGINFNITYQPKFVVGNENQEVLSSNTASKRIIIKNIVDDNYGLAPVVNAGLLVTKNGNMLNVQTKTRFFQSAEGEYYLGVYVIEDGVINYQSGQGNDAVHKSVLRASMSGSSFGELIADGSIAANAEFDKNYAIQLGNWNTNNLAIATIVWKKVGSTYIFVNTHFTTEISTVGVSEIPENEISFQVFPTVTKTSATVELNFKKEQTEVVLELIHPSGRRIATIFEGKATSGTQTFEIDKSLVNSNGLYFLILRSNNAVLTKRIIFQ